MRFSQKKLSRIAAFAAQKDAMPPNFAEKTFANSHKTAKFTKLFSLESFPLYGILFQSCVRVACDKLRVGGGGLGMRLTCQSFRVQTVTPYYMCQSVPRWMVRGMFPWAWSGGSIE